MQAQESHSTLSTDTWVDHPLGRIFVRSWVPASIESARLPIAPIVLFHDSLGCVASWRDFPAMLCVSANRPVIAYDRLGFGQSDYRIDRLDFDFIADEAQNFFPIIRDTLGVQRFVAFGHSVGGSMAVHCATRFSNDCLALITESAQAFPESRTLNGIARAKEKFKDRAQLALLTKCHADKVSWVLDAWTGTWLDPAFASWTLASVLPQVVCPMLAIHGMLDEYGSTCQPEMIAGLTSGPSKIKLLKETHHVPHEEQPKVVVNLVSDFLQVIR